MATQFSTQPGSSMINTREELIDALTEAAELEHGLLLQYLFAAYSMKKRSDEGLDGVQQEAVRRWEGAITAVARDEMAHLGSVCNLLSAIGGAPRFGRPNFPQPHGRYYPFDFRLMRFGDESLYRFMCFELPEGEPPPPPPRPREPVGALRAAEAVVPDPLDFKYVGELYRQIRQGFRAVPERELFIGPHFAQDTDDWSNRMRLHLVVDAASAERAIDAIVLEGEGSPANREGSHYDRFGDIRRELERADDLEPSRPVVADPRTREHRDAPGGGSLLTSPDAVAVAELFNATYITVLLLLLQYYAFGGETPSQRVAIRQALRHLMSGVVRPIAEILTELPAYASDAGATAGPPFELYADVRLAPQVENRWVILLERLDAIRSEARERAAIAPRLAFIGQNVEWIATNIRSAQSEALT
jgi:ferritin-like protein